MKQWRVTWLSGAGCAGTGSTDMCGNLDALEHRGPCVRRSDCIRGSLLLTVGGEILDQTLLDRQGGQEWLDDPQEPSGSEEKTTCKRQAAAAQTRQRLIDAGPRLAEEIGLTG